MSKTLKAVRATDKYAMRKPRCVADLLPIEEYSPDGIFLAQRIDKTRCKFSAVFKIQDISYLVLSDEEQSQVLLAYSAVINALDPGCTAKMSVVKHRLTSAAIDSILVPEDDPIYGELQRDYNAILREKALQGNGMVQEIFLTISAVRRDLAEARTYFIRAESTIQTLLHRMRSSCRRLDGEERLALLYSLLHGEGNPVPEGEISNARDVIAPKTAEITPDFFKFEDLYGRALVLHGYPTRLDTSVVSNLCSLTRPVVFSIDLIPVPADEALREAERRATSVEANISRWYQKQYENKNFAAEPPYDMRQQRQQAQEYLNDLTQRDQRLLYCVVTMVHFAESKEQLDGDTDALVANARGACGCKLSTLKWQQLDGLLTALPFGVRRVDDIYTLLTEGAAGFTPFRCTEIQEQGGYCFGQNQISKNLILIDPKSHQSANSVVLGKPGAGKSMFAKWLILNKVFASAGQNHEVIIIDPEREYAPLVKALGGEVVYLSATAQTHINAMEVSSGYQADDDPIVAKTEFLQSLCEQLMSPTQLTAQQKSIIARCTQDVLGEYVRRGCAGEAPTLVDFYNRLRAQDDGDAGELALALEAYATGRLSTFAKQTNINLNSRVICFDIHQLGRSLMSLGMLVLFDHIQQRMIRSRATGITTSVINDEFYLMLDKRFTSDFFFQMWKRGRKYDCDYSGITQNVEDLLRSENGRAIINTSELVVMLNQSALDAAQLSEMLDISPVLRGYLKDAKEGSGLLKFGGEIVPFENDIPSKSKIYRLLTTKPSEAIYDA